jgi:hypothetical protein
MKNIHNTDELDSSLFDSLTPSEELSISFIPTEIERDEDLEQRIKQLNQFDIDSISRTGIDSFAPPVEEQLVTDSDILLGDKGEGFVYYTAFQYYKELTKRAKKYVKLYAKMSRYKIGIQRSLKDPSKGQKYTKEFNPFVYDLRLSSVNLSTDAETIILQHQAPTAEELYLQVAYRIKFLDTLEFKTAGLGLHAPAMEKILADPKYMASVRKRNIFQIEAEQIKNATYASPSQINNWGEQLQQKIQEEINKMKGAI